MSSSPTGINFEDDKLGHKPEKQEKSNENNSKNANKLELVWFNIISFALLNIGALYGVYLIFTSAKIATTVFAIVLSELTQISVTAGPHRLWSHRSYKAKLPLRLLLVFLQSIAYQYTVISWARDHRLHHKYSDTSADPHNSKRGFFYCHCGWLLSRKSREVMEKGKMIDVSDLFADPILRFQHKYFLYFAPIACFVLPTIIAVYGWNETWTNALFIPSILRWAFTIHCTFLINSFAHMFGNKPYDRNIQPTQNRIVAVLAMGEGWHNYHHAFPWDYKAAELGDYSLNHTAAFIDFFARIGWAYDLKTVSADVVEKRVRRTGDGTHEVWGWGDKDITEEDQEATIITCPQMGSNNDKTKA